MNSLAITLLAGRYEAQPPSPSRQIWKIGIATSEYFVLGHFVPSGVRLGRLLQG